MALATGTSEHQHITQDSIKAAIEKPSQLKSLKDDGHVKQCPRCTELVSLIEEAKNLTGKTSPNIRTSHPSRLEMQESLSKIYEGALTPQQAADFLGHLARCQLCFEYVGLTLQTSLSPVPEELEQEAAQLEISLADAVMQALPPLTQTKPKTRRQKGWVWIPEFIKIENIRAPQIAFALVFVTVIAGSILWQIWQNQNSYLNTFVYDKNVPYEYNTSGFRGSIDLTKDDPQFQTFINQFKLGIADYLVRDYEGTIANLENLEPIVLAWQEKWGAEPIRDYYFYLGVSHFAVSRSQTRDLDKATRTEHNEKAIGYLAKARTLALNHNLQLLDRDSYFLGMAYGFGGQREMAIEEFKRIAVESLYFEDSQKLIKQWSK